MGRRDLIDAAYREYKVTRQVSTGNGEAYLAQWRPPASFFTTELGYGHDKGPSLEETLRNLPAINARNERQFALRENPLATKPKPKKKTKQQRKRQMRSVVHARRVMAAA